MRVKRAIKSNIARVLSALLVAGVICAGVLPVSMALPQEAHAASVADIQVGDHVYMGRADAPGLTGLPYWRVIDKNTEDGSLLFMSEHLWKGDGKDDEDTLIQFNPQEFHYEWQESHARVWCQNFETAVLGSVAGLTVKKTTKSDAEYASKDFYNVVYQARENILNNDTVYFLSAEEVAEQYMTTGPERVAYLHDGNYIGEAESWWLRSPRWLSELNSVTCVGRVFSVGDVGKNEVYQYSAARPVFWGSLADGTPVSQCSHGSERTWVVGTNNAQPQYGAPRYRWAADNTTCTAEAVCRSCGTTVTETVKTTSAVTKEATATEYGIREYRAPFTAKPFTAQVKKLTIPKTEGSVTPAPSGKKAVNPPAVAIKSLSRAKRAFTVKWKKLSSANQKKVTGIEVQYALNKRFTRSPVIKKVKKTKASLKVKKLKSKKTYWVRIRTYKKSGSVKRNSKWSKAKKIKVK